MNSTESKGVTVKFAARKSAIMLSVLFLISLGASGCAVTKTRYSRDGFYAGGSVMGSVSQFDDIEGTDFDSNDLVVGVGLRGGFRFMDRFAFEVSYETSDDFEFTNNVDVSLQTFGINGKFYPTTGRMQPYVLAGVGILDAEINSIDLDEAKAIGRVGVGLEGYISEKIPVFIELDYHVPSEDLSELQYFSTQIGLLFRF